MLIAYILPLLLLAGAAGARPAAPTPESSA